MITQTNSNIGPRGKKPKNLSFPLYFRPKPKDKGGVDFGLPPHFYSLDIHAWNSYFQAPISSRITSLLFPPSLSAETHTHIHKYLSNSLKNTSSLSTQKSRNLGSFQEDLSTNSSSKVRLCLDLWLRFFLSSKPFPNPCQNRDLTS